MGILASCIKLFTPNCSCLRGFIYFYKRPLPLSLYFSISAVVLRYKHARVNMHFNITAIATAVMALLVAQAAAQSNNQECCASTYHTLTTSSDIPFPAPEIKLGQSFLQMNRH